MGIYSEPFQKILSLYLILTSSAGTTLRWLKRRKLAMKFLSEFLSYFKYGNIVKVTGSE